MLFYARRTRAAMSVRILAVTPWAPATGAVFVHSVPTVLAVHVPQKESSRSSSTPPIGLGITCCRILTSFYQIKFRLMRGMSYDLFTRIIKVLLHTKLYRFDFKIKLKY